MKFKRAYLTELDKINFLIDFLAEFGEEKSPGFGELKPWLESKFVQDRYTGDYEQLRKILYILRMEHDLPINPQEVDPEITPTAADYDNRDKALKQIKDKASSWWTEEKLHKLTDLFLKSFERFAKESGLTGGKLKEQLVYKKKKMIESYKIAFEKEGTPIPSDEQFNKVYNEAHKRLNKLAKVLKKIKEAQRTVKLAAIGTCIKCGYGFAGKAPKGPYDEMKPCPSCGFEKNPSTGEQAKEGTKGFSEKYYVINEVQDIFVGPFFGDFDAKEVKEDVINELKDFFTTKKIWIKTLPSYNNILADKDTLIDVTIKNLDKETNIVSEKSLKKDYIDELGEEEAGQEFDSFRNERVIPFSKFKRECREEKQIMKDQIDENIRQQEPLTDDVNKDKVAKVLKKIKEARHAVIKVAQLIPGGFGSLKSDKSRGGLIILDDNDIIEFTDIATEDQFKEELKKYKSFKDFPELDVRVPDPDELGYFVEPDRVTSFQNWIMKKIDKKKEGN